MIWMKNFGQSLDTHHSVCYALAMELRGYDAWKTTEPYDPYEERPVEPDPFELPDSEEEWLDGWRDITLASKPFKRSLREAA